MKNLKKFESNLVKLVNEKLIKFAEEHPIIEAICFGDFVDDKDSYIFIAALKSYDDALHTEIIDLEWNFFHKNVIMGVSVDLTLEYLPLGYEHKNNFLKCIYDNPMEIV